MKYKNPDAKNQPPWNTKTTIQMLENQLHVGDMVQGRYRVRSYRVHIQDAVPEEEWFTVENTHEPIIDREWFAQVQEPLKRDMRMAPGRRKLYLLSGFLRYVECSKSMYRNEVRGTVCYFYRTCKEQSRAACTKHPIRYGFLEVAVLYVIQQQVYMADAHAEVTACVDKVPLKKSQLSELDSLTATKGRELVKITCYKQSLYQDWKGKSLIHKDYRQMCKDYEWQMESIDAAIENLMAEQAGLKKNTEAENPILTAYRKYKNINKLTRDVLTKLVDHIQVSGNSSISVRLKYGDEIRRAEEFIETNRHSGAG